MRSFERLAVLPIVAWSSLAIASTAAPLRAQDQETGLIARERFFEDPVIADVQISPDGRWLAFRAPFDGTMQLWVNTLHFGADSVRRVSDGPVQTFTWTPDSRSLLFFRVVDGSPHLFVVSTDTAGSNPPRDLTPIDGIDVRLYTVVDSVPAVIVVGLNDRDSTVHDIYRIDVRTGARELIRQNPGDVADWLVDRHGVVRLGLRYGPDGGVEFLRIHGDTLDAVYGCGPDDTCLPLRFHRDDRRIFLITNRGDRDRTELVLFHPETFEEEFVDRDPAERVDLGDVVFSPGSRALLATVYYDDTTRVYAQDSAFTIHLERLAAHVAVGGLSFGNASGDGARWVLGDERVGPPDLYLYDRWPDTVRLLRATRPALLSDQLAVPTWIRFTARDGREIAALLTVPRGDRVMAGPAILLPHDGPWVLDRAGFRPWAQFFANRGYVVLQPNFRGSTGYGKDHLAAGNQGWGTGGMQQDLLDAVDYLVNNGLADPDRIAVVGFGYGGYAALAGLAYTPDVFAAGVAVGAINDLPRYLAEGSPAQVLARPRLYHRIGNPETAEGLARLDSLSPIHAVSAFSRPVLLVHGVLNRAVSALQSERIVQDLRDAGKAVEYLRVPGEGETLQRADNRIAVAAVVERFLAQHLGGRIQDSTAAPVASLIATLTVPPGAPLGPTALATTATVPVVDGGGITPVTFVYRWTTNDGGESEFARRIESTTLGGRPVWRMIDSTMVPVLADLEFDSTQFADPEFEPALDLAGRMEPAADTLDVDRLTLRPLQRRTRGLATITLDYTADRVRGELDIAGFIDDIDVPLVGPVFAGGTGLDLLLAGLPLDVGYQTTLNVFDHEVGTVALIRLTVASRDSVSTPAGSFDAFRVTVSPADAPDSPSRTLFVRVTAPHHLVRDETDIRDQLGTLRRTTELISTTGGAR